MLPNGAMHVYRAEVPGVGNAHTIPSCTKSSTATTIYPQPDWPSIPHNWSQRTIAYLPLILTLTHHPGHCPTPGLLILTHPHISVSHDWSLQLQTPSVVQQANQIGHPTHKPFLASHLSLWLPFCYLIRPPLYLHKYQWWQRFLIWFYQVGQHTTWVTELMCLRYQWGWNENAQGAFSMQTFSYPCYRKG